MTGEVDNGDTRLGRLGDGLEEGNANGDYHSLVER